MLDNLSCQLMDYDYSQSTGDNSSFILQHLYSGRSGKEAYSYHYGNDIIVLSDVRERRWLIDVARRLRDSIDDKVLNSENDGSSITSAVALSAIDFLRVMASSLPCEPYIYASTNGHLVAEFHCLQYLLTVVISPDGFLVRRNDLEDNFYGKLPEDFELQRKVKSQFQKYLLA